MFIFILKFTQSEPEKSLEPRNIVHDKTKGSLDHIRPNRRALRHSQRATLPKRLSLTTDLSVCTGNDKTMSVVG